VPALTDGPAGQVDAPARGGGIFFQTEPELGDDSPWPAPPAVVSSAFQAPTFQAAVHPRGPPGAGGRAMPKSSSTPVLPSIRQGSTESSSSRTVSAASLGLAGRRISDGEQTPQEAAARKAKVRLRHVTKAFEKAIIGKSILVFTDQKPVWRSIEKAFVSPAETRLCWVKSTAELWQRLYDAKEHYSALLLDLSKVELEVESVLNTIKQLERYCRMPIIVISTRRELPELVRTVCSFVVFLPLSAATLRESLLWCFDRHTVQQHCSYDMLYATPEEGEPDGWDGKADTKTPTLGVRPMSTVKGTKVS